MERERLRLWQGSAATGTDGMKKLGAWTAGTSRMSLSTTFWPASRSRYRVPLPISYGMSGTAEGTLVLQVRYCRRARWY
eukprot:1517779-Rhodomonas_salina.1